MSSLLNVNEVIAEMKISRATLYRLIDEGLPYVVIGARKKMFNPEEVAAFLTKRKDSVIALEVGKEYTNKDICECFRVAYMGAIRKSNTKNALVLISYPYASRFNYHDYWSGDILYFYGQGSDGDQEISRGYNKDLIDSPNTSISLYLFESFTEGKYNYRGIVELAGKVEIENVNDKNGNRNVFKFPLKLVNQNDYLSEEFIDKEVASMEKEVLDMNDIELVEVAELIRTPIMERKVISKKIQRNPYVAKYARMRAKGYCELCGAKAPFEIKGEPYLEIDHIIPISQGGTDSVDNVAALCPNCNKRKAFSVNPDDVVIIRNNVAKDEAELQQMLNNKSK